MNDFRYEAWRNPACMKTHWLAKRLKTTGKRNRGLAKHLGVPDSRISEIINGRREVQTDEIEGVAEFLDWTLEELMRAMGASNGRGSSGVALLIKGTVQAGLWMREAHLPPEDWKPSGLPVPPEYRDSDPFVLKVVGSSMDEVYPDGTLIVCVSTLRMGRELRSGDRVVVQRKNRNGEFEITVKQYAVEGARKWLVARSTKPEFRGAVEMQKKGTESIEAVALVVASYRFENSSEGG